MFAIGEAARLSGVSIETIRYYEREGIIAPPQRSQSGRRVFSEAAVAELRFIRRGRDMGFSLAEIAALRGLSGSGAGGTAEMGTCAAAGALGRAHLAKVRAKLADLRRLEKALAELVANCEEGRPDCPMLDELMAVG